MKWSIICLCFLISAWAAAQDTAYVKHQIAVLASDSMQGRGYVNNGMGKAADYIASAYDSIGLQPVNSTYFQAFGYGVNTFPDSIFITVNKKVLGPGIDFIAAPESGTSVGNYRVHRIDSAAVAQKSMTLEEDEIAVLPQYELPPDVIRTFLENTLQANPLVELEPKKLTWSVGRRFFPQAWLQVKDAAWPDSATTVEMQISPHFVQDFEARNVVGFLPGKNTDSTVVFSAHYDHLGKMGPALFAGASDNASGVAMLLDLAGYYAAHTPEYNTVFIAFAGEEAGLVGSRYFVDHPLIDLSAVKLLINLDLMGSAADGITVVNGKIYPELMSKLKDINEAGHLLPKIKLRGKAANSDHYWFSEKGVPAIFIYTLGNITAYHDVYDVPAVVDLENYEQLFELITKFVATL